MRVYLAGMLVTGLAYESPSATENILAAEEAVKAYPWVLESFHYIKTNTMIPRYLRDAKKQVFLDSGAFSMFTQKVHVSLEEYASYIKANRDWIYVASNLDAIGSGKEQESYDNQKALQRLVPDNLVMPVHHVRDDDKWLQRYMAEGYDYIFLGGMVPESTKYLYQWLDHIWEKYLTRKDGTPKLKVHGFGLTSLDLVRRYPWFSVDSTRWVLSAAYGMILIDLPHRDIMITVSEDSPKVHDLDGHLDNYSDEVKKMFLNRIQELGYDSKTLRTHYGWRRKFNIEFFLRFCERPDPVFIRQERTLFG